MKLFNITFFKWLSFGLGLILAVILMLRIIDSNIATSSKVYSGNASIDIWVTNPDGNTATNFVLVPSVKEWNCYKNGKIGRF